jgi:ribonuclease P protein component
MESSGEERKRGRLSRSGDFERVYREGTSHGNRFLVLYAFPRRGEPEAAGDELRLGISVGRKVGGAVDRNAVKRAIKEAFWSASDELPVGHDFVLVARPDLAGLVERDGTGGVAGALRELLEAAGLTGGSAGRAAGA